VSSTRNLARSRTYVAASLLVLALVSPAAAKPRQRATQSAASAFDISRIRIDNFGRIDSNYYRGAQPQDHDYADLAALGVKTLINLTSDDAQANEAAMARDAGMKYFQIPMTTHRVPTPTELATFLKIVTDPARQPVYVHCVGGRHRTGVMTAVYRMTRDGWTADQAFKEMKQYKFGADFLHREFKDFVYGYHPLVAAAAAPVVAATKAANGGSH
jgi:uncharacterized protein (TIGR01244 family)